MYKLYDDFSVRTALLSPKKNVSLADMQVQEAVYLSSPTFYELYSENEQEPEYQLKLKQFLLRMTTRATPFGLSSLYSLKNFSEELGNSPKKNETVITRNIRPDGEWLIPVLKKLELEYLQLENLKVIYNEAVEIRADKLINRWIKRSQYNLKGTQQIIVDRTNAVKLVQELAVKPIEIKELINQILLSSPKIARHVISGFLQELIQKNILISELFFLPNKGDRFNFIIKQIQQKTLTDTSNALIVIAESIATVENNPTIENYRVLKEKMSMLFKAPEDKYLQVDGYRNSLDFLLNKEQIEEKFTDLFEYLEELGLNIPRIQNKDLQMMLIDKYGLNVAVPLTYVLDDVGLQVFLEEKPNEDIKQMIGTIGQKLDESCLLNKKAISLDELFSKITPPKKVLTNHALDIEVGASLYQTGDQELGICLSTGLNSFTYNKLNSRFLKAESEHVVKAKKNYEQTIEVDIVTDAKYYMMDNVMQGGITNKFIFECNAYLADTEYERIELTDIYLFADYERLGLYSKKHDKQLKFALNSAVNPASLPPLPRILLKIAGIQYDNPLSSLNFLEEISTTRVHTPKVMYKDIILLPEKWDLSSHFYEHDTYQIFENKLMMLMKNEIIPKLVLFMKMDKRLQFDLTKAIDRKILFKEWKKSSQLFLSEVIYPIDYSLAKNEINQPVQNEFIFEFYYSGEETKRHPDCFWDDVAQRVVYPNNQWMYYILKTNDLVFYDQLIGQYFHQLQNVLNEQGSRLFFIRYLDEHGPQLRVRIYNKAPEKLSQSIAIFNEKLEKWHQEKVISGYLVDIYEREGERYGGLSIYPYVEDFFEADSYLVMLYYNLEKKLTLSFSSDALGIFSIITLVTSTTFDEEKRIEVVKDLNERKAFRKQFRQVKSELITLLELYENEELLQTASVETRAFLTTLHWRNGIFNKFWEQLDKKITDPWRKRYIVRSIIHLFCNRFFGIDSEKERQLCINSGYGIYELEQYKKFKHYRNKK
ncbi:thiopeptide-type bacteriocin biosynthesis protein [Candidatus Enterococcus ikei]|uniref:Thiopeptide-type bacteriocin biosynthesis protein n=1 Tax=Candidatus Enterococcus ikei TaxID=2815326 RepID=A0ABS3GV18_9ENTE|nr:thiopeptide-type bacteriocin biosynthesis protein [Enterococcus sp. DIV0869a]MBO0439108.1 thiopeptide-type bacteriocin biosynthesis protein [Enterococcus sp. DIV0869a]